jgi:uncharacterized protein YoxC
VIIIEIAAAVLAVAAIVLLLASIARPEKF